MTQTLLVDLSNWAFEFGLSASPLRHCSPGWAFGFSSHRWVCVPVRRSDVMFKSEVVLHSSDKIHSYLPLGLILYL